MDIKFTACTPADFKIKTLYEDFYKLNKIDFNAEYQRSEVWRLPKKQLLLDSILRNFDISKIFLRQLVDGRYECLDGQQRLKAIFGYLEDEFSLSGKETPEVGRRDSANLATNCSGESRVTQSMRRWFTTWTTQQPVGSFFDFRKACL